MTETPSTAPFFSVVVPLYNKAQHIGRTLRSLLAQSFQDFEVVVVDDGSTDGSASVVSALNHPKVRLIQVRNGGVSAARNTAIAASKGAWVAFLDADDWYHPEHLAVLAGTIESQPDAVYVASGYRSIDESKLATFKGWALEPCRDVECITDLPRRWMKGQSFFTSSVSVKRPVLKAAQPCFPVGESHGEDLDLWFRLAEQGPVYFNPTVTVGRTWVAGSLSTQTAKTVAPPFMARMRTRATAGRMAPQLRQSTLWFIDQQLLTMARHACASGNRSAGKELFQRTSVSPVNVRWWVTLLMVHFVPAYTITAFQRWRTQRNMNVH